MSSPIQLIPHDDDNDNNDANEPDEFVIVQNISVVTNDNAGNNEQQPHQIPQGGGDDDGNDDDASLSVSSATSATSIASALSDGNTRPRSASVGLPARHPNGSSSSSTPRQRSTPRSRPRSNPRTRTPMRRESPLLITGGRDALHHRDRVHVVVSDDNNNNEALIANGAAVASGANNEESMVRNIFNTSRPRSRRNRAGSIPEEEDEVMAASVAAAAETNETSGTANANNNDAQSNASNNNAASATATGTSNASSIAPRSAGHWFARAAVVTSAANSSSRSERSSNPTRSRGPNRTGLSDKQRPSHRKLRRWNNDRFVGTSSEQTHILVEEFHGGDGGDPNFAEHYMPHYPLEYRSEFAKLCGDESRRGKDVRERFVRGEVGGGNGRKGNGGRKNNNGGGGSSGKEDGWLERSAMAKFQKLGISFNKPPARADESAEMTNATNNAIIDDETMGRKLFGTLAPRIRSVLSRSCALGKNASFASQVVAAFETYLVSLALAGSEKDATASTAVMGYPPQQPRSVYDIFDKIFVNPPKIVMRNNKRHGSSSSDHRGFEKQAHAALVPTVHFYFSAENVKGNDGRVTSTAFYRILLYAVCQFHGLESSSSVLSSPIGTQRRRRRGGGGTGQSNSDNQQGMVVKVVTVQGGVLLAPALKLLDCVE
mmetsp:Transcript_23886/g.50640  ORF Transcript_23886/g.50640 Transcript_23886/m.50640 type:complete len:659 (-) Transcript_23886:95-2071(-)